MEKLSQLSLHLSTGSVLVIVGVLLFLYMSVWTLFAIAKKKADLADVAWGLGFLLVAWVSFFLGNSSYYGLILNLLVTIWAIRLALHIYYRNRNRAEDFRYQALKKDWGKNVNFKLFTHVFLLQGVILYIVALPIIWIHTHYQQHPWQSLWFALPLWTSGFFLETMADRELTLFKEDSSNKGKILTSGSWSYVRHPNYLGELMQWWAIWIMAAALPDGLALIISPLLLSFLMVKVSGVKPLEDKMKSNPEFKAYAEKTPSILPPPMVNGILYWVTWLVLVNYGSNGSLLIPIIGTLGYYAAQIALFLKYDRTSLRLCIPLSIIALVLGLILEMIFIQFGVLSYPHNKGIFPPFWLLVLYPLFSLTLNSSLSFLNRNLLISFILTGIGAVLSYLSGEKSGGVQLFLPLAYPAIFIGWGLFITILVIINRRLTRTSTLNSPK